MKPLASCFVVLMTLGLVLPLAASDHDGASQAAFAVGLGRSATTAENKHSGSFKSTVAELREDLAAAPAQHREVAARAYVFVYGESSGPSKSDGLLWADVVAAHLADLSRDSAAYEKVLQRAYQHVIGRNVYAEEITYWSEYPTLPYALLVGCIEDWARRNQPGLMNTAGDPTISINCELLETVRVSGKSAPSIAKLLGLPADTTVLAPGGTDIISSGDIRFLVIGTR